MYNFFVSDDSRQGEFYFISGGDYNHIVNVLRMKTGEEFLVSDGGASNLCCIENISPDSVQVRIVEENYKVSELPIEIYLFQGLPKSDKMELIIQKSTELGAVEIIPTEMKRSIVKLDEKRKKNKTQRWQSIAESAAKQSKRNVIPNVSEVMSFPEAVKKAEELDLVPKTMPFSPEYSANSSLTTARICLPEICNFSSINFSSTGFPERNKMAFTTLLNRLITILHNGVQIVAIRALCYLKIFKKFRLFYGNNLQF